MLYWRIYQAARKRINKRKTETSSVRKHKKSETPKKMSAAKFRFKNRNKIPTDDWDSSQNSEAVSAVDDSLSLELMSRFSESFNAFEHKVGEQRQQQ